MQHKTQNCLLPQIVRLRYSQRMWGLALWGLFGGFAVEALEFTGAIRRTGTWPWHLRLHPSEPNEPLAVPMLASVILRLSVSAGVVAALASSHQVAGTYTAIGAGIAAPKLIEQLLQQTSVGATRASRSRR